MVKKQSSAAGRPPWATVLSVACSSAAIGFVMGLAFRERVDLKLWWLVPLLAGMLGLIVSLRGSWKSPLARDNLVRPSVLFGVLVVLALVVTIGLEAYWTWMCVAAALSWLFIVLATVTDRRDSSVP